MILIIVLWAPSFMLKSDGVGGGGGGLEQFSVSPRPLGFGFGTKWFGAKGLGPGLDNSRLINTTVFIKYPKEIDK